MNIAVGSGHIGWETKKYILEYLIEKGFQAVDLGTYSVEPVDYPDIAEKVALRVSAREFDRGILICGTGIGMSIAANKIPGILAAQIYDIYSAERAMKSNNARIACVGSQTIGRETLILLIQVWLESEYLGGRSAPKVEKLIKIDEKYRVREGEKNAT
jgi:ribose 5-phosphate isomerase B